MPDLKYPRKVRDSLFWTSRNCTGPPPRWSSSCVAKMAAAPLSSCEHSSPIIRNQNGRGGDYQWCRFQAGTLYILKTVTLPKALVNSESSPELQSNPSSPVNYRFPDYLPKTYHHFLSITGESL